MKAVQHEITLIAFGRDNGFTVVMDIVETSRKFAPKFARRFYRNADVIEFAAVKPKCRVENWSLQARTIYRSQG